MAPARIVVTSEVFPPRHGGSGRWLWELYRRLAGSEIDVSVLAGPAAGAEAFDATSPVRIERLPFRFAHWGVAHPRALRDQWHAAGRLRALTADGAATAVHCGKCLPEGLTALIAGWRTGVPYWCFAHGEELTLAEGSRELAWLTRRVLNGAVRLIANSEHTRRLLVERWHQPPARVTVLHPGVDTTRYVPAAPDAAARAELGWSDRLVILTVGALQARKGQDMMIRALPAIQRDIPNVLFAMAGDGPDRARLERLAGEHGAMEHVQFLGAPSNDHVVRLYQQCDLFALPNRQIGWDFEGFGIVLLEAQACGKAVVAGNSGGTAETMIADETGVLVPCDTPDPLAAACVTLLADAGRRAAMGARAREWAVERFSWPALTAQARALFLPNGPAGS